MGIPPFFHTGYGDAEPAVVDDAKAATVSAEIYYFYEHSAFLSFDEVVEGHVEPIRRMAAFTPGKMFVNGRRNLLTLLPTREALRKFFGKGKAVKAKVMRCRSPLSLIFSIDEDGYDFVKSKSYAGKRDRRTTSNEFKSITHVVRAIWPDEYDGEPNECDDPSFNEVVAKIDLDVLINPSFKAQNGDKPTVSYEAFPWKMIHEMPDFMNGGAFKIPTEREVAAKVIEIIEPHGGVVATNDEKFIAFFVRSNVVYENKPIGYTEKLDDFLAVGSEVTVDITPYSPKEEYTGVVRKLYVKSNPKKQGAVHLPTVRDCHVLKVVQLEGNDNDATSPRGLVSISPSSYLRNLFNGEALIGQVCTFTSSDIFCGNFDLSGCDLPYLLRIGEEFYGTLEKQVGGSYRVVFGSTFSNKGNNFLSELTISNTSFFTRMMALRMSWAMFEATLYGRTSFASTHLPSDRIYAYGYVFDLEEPKSIDGKMVVTRGRLCIMSGPLKDKVLTFDRKDLSVFGYDLSMCDLSWIVFSRDRIIVDTSSYSESGDTDCQNGHESLKCYLADKVRSVIVDCNPETMMADDRMKFHTWLNTRNLTYDEFVSVMKGNNEARPFIPFPLDKMRGRTIKLNTGKRTGIMQVEDGYFSDVHDYPNLKVGEHSGENLAGQKVFFRYQDFWIYYRNMGLGDLAHLVPENQKIFLEVKTVTDEYRTENDVPEDIKYRASIAWIGPSRPTHDSHKPDMSGSQDWIRKKNYMTMAKFASIAEGNMEDVKPEELNENGFHLVQIVPDSTISMPFYEKERVDKKKEEKQAAEILASKTLPKGIPSLVDEAKKTHPIMRYGIQTVDMLQGALSTRGPDDPILDTLISNDDMAQTAHQVSHALTYALNRYRQRTMTTRSHQGYGNPRINNDRGPPRLLGDQYAGGGGRKRQSQAGMYEQPEPLIKRTYDRGYY